MYLNRLLKIISDYKRIIKYGIFSILVTIIDTSIVYVLFGHVTANIVIANTTGVIIGFIIHYFLAIDNVFATKPSLASFSIYLGTFFIGLILADYIIWLFYHVFMLGFFVSKGASIVIPFFVMYGMRKAIYSNLGKVRSM